MQTGGNPTAHTAFRPPPRAILGTSWGQILVVISIFAQVGFHEQPKDFDRLTKHCPTTYRDQILVVIRACKQAAIQQHLQHFDHLPKHCQTNHKGQIKGASPGPYTKKVKSKINSPLKRALQRASKALLKPCCTFLGAILAAS